MKQVCPGGISSARPLVLAACIITASITGCYTHQVRGSSGLLRIESEPSGATILVNQRQVGQAPLNLRIDRTDSWGHRHRITIKAEFASPASVIRTHVIEPWSSLPDRIVFKAKKVQPQDTAPTTAIPAPAPPGQPPPDTSTPSETEPAPDASADATSAWVSGFLDGLLALDVTDEERMRQLAVAVEDLENADSDRSKAADGANVNREEAVAAIADRIRSNPGLKQSYESLRAKNDPGLVSLRRILDPASPPPTTTPPAGDRGLTVEEIPSAPAP